MTEATSIWLADCQPTVPTSSVPTDRGALWGTDVLVVGAGITGLLVALGLAESAGRSRSLMPARSATTPRPTAPSSSRPPTEPPWPRSPAAQAKVPTSGTASPILPASRFSILGDVLEGPAHTPLERIGM
jgi:hypothetical protein